MKYSSCVAVIYVLFVSACAPDFVPPYQYAPALYERFHGKYKVVQSTSNVAVDINLDGVASTDLKQEMGVFKYDYDYYLELRIYNRSKNKNPQSNAFLLTQWWPEQAIFIPTNKTQRWEGEDLAYRPDIDVMGYEMQGRVRWFDFSPDLREIVVKPNDEKDTRDVHRWTIPDNVTVLPGSGEPQIRVVNRRRFYTRDGVKEVLVTTVYQRFTMVT